MIRLAGNLDARRADDLTPLPEAGAPTELHPFITSINSLLARMRHLMDQQRRFVADAAHELRTPVTALSLQAENLNSIELPEEARERVAALRQGIHRTKHLLEQLLAVARYEAKPFSDEMQQVPLDQVAKQVAADLLPQAVDRGIDLGFEIVEAVTVRGEPVMLATMIRNLIENALRHTPHGGRIVSASIARTVRQSCRSRTPAPASLPLTWRKYSSRSFAAPVRRAKELASASQS